MSCAAKMLADELTNLRVRTYNRRSMVEMRDQPAQRAKAGQKYGNTKVLDAGLKFDSKAEHKRWQYLAVLERAGKFWIYGCRCHLS